MLCMQTTDTSIELYWHDDMLRSRQGSGTPPSVHIPVVEEFADRLAKKMDAEQRALDLRGARPHRLGALHRRHADRRQRRRTASSTPTSGRSGIPACTSWTAA